MCTAYTRAFIASYGTAYARAYNASYGTAYVRAYNASYGTAYTRAYIASYGTAYARAYNASYGTVQEKPAITDDRLWADIHPLRPILYHFLLPRSPSVAELLSVVTRPAVD